MTSSSSPQPADVPEDIPTDREPFSTEALSELSNTILGWRHKAAPAAAAGKSVADFVSAGKTLADFQTPLLTLDAGAIRANLDRLADWCRKRNILLAPHGKTTMAPQLWAEQLRRGAWGISLANTAQLRVARAFGFRKLMLANSLTDPLSIAWVAGESSADAPILSWVDSVETVRLLDSVLAGLEQPAVLPILLEVGGLGGRTGARGFDTALSVARAVASSAHLRLVGVSGYEGSLAHTGEPEALAAVRNFLLDMKAVHTELLAAELYEPGTAILLTAGGSAYFDTVADVLGPCITPAGPATGGRRIDLALRSGAYVIHDDGFYRGISPFSRHGNAPLVSGMHGWARVVSSPEPGLAILDAGKRDLPVDEGLPIPQFIAEAMGGPLLPLTGASIPAVNDQHCFLHFDPATTTVRIGNVVRLGLSHPCTALDKWNLIPVMDGAEGNPAVVDLVQTFF